MCGDTMDIVDGCPTGSVRISFGYMSTMEDARRFIEFIVDTFVKPVSVDGQANFVADLFPFLHLRSSLLNL